MIFHEPNLTPGARYEDLLLYNKDPLRWATKTKILDYIPAELTVVDLETYIEEHPYGVFAGYCTQMNESGTAVSVKIDRADVLLMLRDYMLDKCKHFIVTQEICDQLQETRVGTELETQFLRPPFDYIIMSLKRPAGDLLAFVVRRNNMVYIDYTTSSPVAIGEGVVRSNLFNSLSIKSKQDCLEDFKEIRARVCISIPLENNTLQSLIDSREYLTTAFKTDAELWMFVNALFFVNTPASAKMRDMKKIRKLQTELQGAPKSKKQHVQKLLQKEKNLYIYITDDADVVGAKNAESVEKESGHTVRGHLRRGHFWTAPCGAGRLQRELRWRRPCYVNPNETEQVLKDYLVK